MDRSGTTPDPPASSISGPPSPGSHTKYPPTGPRSSSSSPARSSPVRYGETSPSSSRSTVMATGSPGAEAIEYSRSAV